MFFETPETKTDTDAETAIFNEIEKRGIEARKKLADQKIAAEKIEDIK